MNGYDAFAGWGGGSLALRLAGITPTGACEISARARDAYRLNFPEVPVDPDVRTVQPPRVDVLVAGFPCPPFSSAGKQLGFDDPRGLLFREAIRISKHAQYLLLENVSGLARMVREREHILESLRDSGWYPRWMVHSAVESGLPTLRKRWWCCCFREQKHYAAFDWPNLFQPLIDAPKLSMVRREMEPADELSEVRANGFVHPKQPRYVDEPSSWGKPVGTFLKCSIETCVVRDRNVTRNPHGLRFLSPREMASAHGYPEDWKLPESRHLCRELIGNSFCPTVASEMLGAMMRVESCL